jgi:putative membrane protein
MWFIGLIILIAVGYFFFREYRGTDLLKKDDETPLEVLKKRYAKGEISLEEFEEMKNKLRKS